MFGTKQVSPLDKLINAMERHVRVHGESFTQDVLFRQEVVRLNASLASLLEKSSILPDRQLDEVRKAVRACQGVLVTVKAQEGIE